LKVERLVQSVNGSLPIRSRSRHRRNRRDLVARNAARLIEGALNRRWIGCIPSQNTGAYPRSVELAIKIAEKPQTDGVKFVLPWP